MHDENAIEFSIIFHGVNKQEKPDMESNSTAHNSYM